MRKTVAGPLPISGNTPPPDFIYDPPTDPWISIIHKDLDILVLSKPSGLLTVSGKDLAHSDSLEKRAQRKFKSVRVVHRLDRGTSGLLVMALNTESHRNLGMQFERRKTQKTYIAVVAGTVSDDSDTINLPLVTDWYNRPKQMVEPMLGRPATTHWRVLERFGSYTRMELTPISGRSHQLRVHMQAIGHPILGDTFYAPPEIAAVSPRLMLHAEKLSFFHPSDGREVRFCDPCPY